MFSLFYGLWKYLFQKDEYFVLILGLDNAGKTTYLEQTKTKFNSSYKGISPSKITTTVGLNIGKVDIGGVRLNFWDLGGQDELQSLWDKYYAESHAVIYVIDSSDKDRHDESRQAFGCVLHLANTPFHHYNFPILNIDKMVVSESLAGVPLLVLANKQDIAGCSTIADIKAVFNASAHRIGRRDCLVLPVSALRGDGLNEGIQWIVQCVKRNVMRPPRSRDER